MKPQYIKHIIPGVMAELEKAQRLRYKRLLRFLYIAVMQGQIQREK